jgi:hypothetical protein
MNIYFGQCLKSYKPVGGNCGLAKTLVESAYGASQHLNYHVHRNTTKSLSYLSAGLLLSLPSLLFFTSLIHSLRSLKQFLGLGRVTFTHLHAHRFACFFWAGLLRRGNTVPSPCQRVFTDKCNQFRRTIKSTAYTKAGWIYPTERAAAKCFRPAAGAPAIPSGGTIPAYVR